MTTGDNRMTGLFGDCLSACHDIYDNRGGLVRQVEKTDNQATANWETDDEVVAVYDGWNRIVTFEVGSSVPHGEIKNQPDSASAVFSCGTGPDESDPTSSQTPIPRISAFRPGSTTSVLDAQIAANAAFESGLSMASDTLCEDTELCFREIEVKIKREFGADLWARALVAENTCNRSETVRCNR